MRVDLEDIPPVSLGNRGILIPIRSEEGKNLGKLWIGQATVRWAHGATQVRNAKSESVSAFVDYVNAVP